MTLNSLLQLTNPWPSVSRSNWNLKMLVFEERGKELKLGKNLSEQGREPTTNSTHIQCSHHFAILAPLLPTLWLGHLIGVHWKGHRFSSCRRLRVFFIHVSPGENGCKTCWFQVQKSLDSTHPKISKPLV